MTIQDEISQCELCRKTDGGLCSAHAKQLMDMHEKTRQTEARLRAERDQLLRLADAARYWRRREYPDLPEGAPSDAIVQAVGEVGVESGEADLILEVDRWNATLERD